MNILITSGRSFVSLEYIRILKGNAIFIQENQEEYICKYSNSVAGFCITASPRFEFEKYRKQIMDFISLKKIDLIIPTCEDIFYISQLKEDIESVWVKIMCDTFDKLKTFHSKKNIMEISMDLWIQIPRTIRFTKKEELLHFISLNPDFQYVVKPEYSRFANYISSNMIRNSVKIDDIKINLDTNSYIIQEFIGWQNVCSFSIFDNWNLVSHLNYKCLLTYNNWSATFFENFESTAILNFVKAFARKNSLSWQISFDYIMKEDGTVYLIECNPRTTSGIHLLWNDESFRQTFTGFISGAPYTEFILKSPVRNGFLFVNLVFTFSIKKLSYWLLSLRYDVVFCLRDIYPFLIQIRLLNYYKRYAKKRGMTIPQATSYDIEYDGV